MSIPGYVVSQALGAARRVQQETERVFRVLVRHRLQDGADLPGEASRLLAKLENRVVHLRKEFQELERVHQTLHSGAEPLQEVQDLHRRIAQIEKRLGDSRDQPTPPA